MPVPVLSLIAFMVATSGQPVSQNSVATTGDAKETQVDFVTTSLASLHLAPENLKWGNGVSGVKLSLNVLPKNFKIAFENLPILAITVCNNSPSTLTIQVFDNRVSLSLFTIVNGVKTFLYPKELTIIGVGDVQIQPNEMMTFVYPFDIQSYDPQYVPFAVYLSLRNQQSHARVGLLSNVVSGDDISKVLK